MQKLSEFLAMQNQNYNVPKIDKDAPLAIEKEGKDYEENPLEKRGKALFVAGSIFSAFILLSSWVIFWIWLNG